jgi:hypothetical protein
MGSASQRSTGVQEMLEAIWGAVPAVPSSLPFSMLDGRGVGLGLPSPASMRSVMPRTSGAVSRGPEVSACIAEYRRNDDTGRRCGPSHVIRPQVASCSTRSTGCPSGKCATAGARRSERDGDDHGGEPPPGTPLRIMPRHKSVRLQAHPSRSSSADVLLHRRTSRSPYIHEVQHMRLTANQARNGRVNQAATEPRWRSICHRSSCRSGPKKRITASVLAYCHTFPGFDAGDRN